MKEFGNRLRKLRLEKGLTQQQLGEKAGGISSNGISHYEQGKREPSFEVLVQFADLFDVSVDWLLGNTNERRTADDISDETLDEFLDSQMDRLVFRDMRELSEHDKRQVYLFIRHVLRGGGEEQAAAKTQ